MIVAKGHPVPGKARSQALTATLASGLGLTAKNVCRLVFLIGLELGPRSSPDHRFLGGAMTDRLNLVD
jgi:hypothetical protein